MSAEVSREYLKALAVGYFARLDFLQCRLDGRVHERIPSDDWARLPVLEVHAAAQLSMGEAGPTGTQARFARRH